MSSRRRPSRFGPSSVVKKLTPVELPLGRLRLATSPTSTGSTPTPKMIGIVVVAAFAVNAEGPSVATSSFADRRTRSDASIGRRSYCPSEKR